MNEQENIVSFFRFKDLRLYAKALDYARWVHESFNQFPEIYHTTLASSFGKAAQSIVVNIAEGTARSKTQFIHYLRLSKNLIRECAVYTELARKLELYSEADHEYSLNQLIELTKMMGSLGSSLQKSVDASKFQSNGEEI